MSSRSASSSSSSPEPPAVSVKDSKKLKAKKVSTKSKKTAVAAQEKNEGTDLNWDYKPPKGSILLDQQVDAGEFDWDAVKNDDDTELWLIRVPDGFRPKYLENTKIELAVSSKSEKVGTLNRKQSTYDIWSIENDDEQLVGGEEIKALACLLPRKTKKGKLYRAPKPIARHVVICAQPVTPTPSDASTLKSEPRESYPTDVLTHRFMPYGSQDPIEEDEVVSMDVDVVDVDVDKAKSPKKSGPSPKKESTPAETKKTKGKKRKGEGDAETPTAKKVKKARTSS